MGLGIVSYLQLASVNVNTFWVRAHQSPVQSPTGVGTETQRKQLAGMPLKQRAEGLLLKCSLTFLQCQHVNNNSKRAT